MTVPRALPDDEPFELIEGLLAGVLHLIRLTEGASARVALEQRWWSLRGMKRGAEAVLAGSAANRRRMTTIGRRMLLANFKAERAGVYRCAACLGLVPCLGYRPPHVVGTEESHSTPNTPGQALSTLLGL